MGLPRHLETVERAERRTIMELGRRIELLSESAAYPHSVEAIDVRQTHISVVFLAGEWAYKIKKPVDLGFVDARSIESRRHLADEEVRLNRRLAPEVYEGVVPVARSGAGLRVEGPGEVVDWAVKMVRLPDEATLRARLVRGEVDVEAIEDLARRVAAFHSGADGGPAIAEGGRFEVVEANTLENLEQARAKVGQTISRTGLDRLHTLFRSALERLRPTIEGRALRGVPRDTHGDLRLDHVYLFPDRGPPRDLAIIDGIEFDARYRHADPVADMAFLVMELRASGRPDLADAFAGAYFQETGDAEGQDLLTFYTAYRAAVRAKVEGIRLDDPGVSDRGRDESMHSARALWLLALDLLEAPDRRPCLLMVGGLPGVGKSTLARGLAQAAGFEVIRSDEVRKEIARPDESAPAGFGRGIYTPERDDRTYGECLARAEALLFEGRRVVVDASFREEGRRLRMIEAARRWGVTVALLECRAGGEVARARIRGRVGDASDADCVIHQRMAEHWDDPGPATAEVTYPIGTDQNPDETLHQALAILRRLGLVGRS